ARRIRQHGLEERLLHLADDELVEITWLMPVQIAEVMIETFVGERAQRPAAQSDRRARNGHPPHPSLGKGSFSAGGGSHYVLPEERKHIYECSTRYSDRRRCEKAARPVLTRSC